MDAPYEPDPLSKFDPEEVKRRGDEIAERMRNPPPPKKPEPPLPPDLASRRRRRPLFLSMALNAPVSSAQTS